MLLRVSAPDAPTRHGEEIVPPIVPPELGVAQTAAVPLDAVGTCPLVGVPVIETPFIWVALITPLPDAPRVAPLPTVIAAAPFVPDAIPENGTDVAAIVPEPVVDRLPPLPTTKAFVFVPAPMAEKFGLVTAEGKSARTNLLNVGIALIDEPPGAITSYTSPAILVFARWPPT
jgi:hypothetical protein